MEGFSCIVAEIEMANKLYQEQHYEQYQHLLNNHLANNKIPENSQIFHNIYNENKIKKIAERDLHRPWFKLTPHNKILVILNFMELFRIKNAHVNLSYIMYDTLCNINKLKYGANSETSEISKGIDTNVDYDNLTGKIKKIFGYTIKDNKVVKSNNQHDFISVKFKFNLRFKNNI